MTPKHILLSGLLLLLFSIRTFSQNDWLLKQDKEGIKVYTKNLENSPFKAVKTVCTVDASLTKLTAVLLDINSSKDWVYSTKVCTVLKQLTPSELIYYSEVAVPWPVNNRDFIVRLKVSQDAKTKIITVEGDNRPTLLPEKKNVVRIQQCYSKWIIVPQANGQVKIEYVLQVDPGGMIPAWLINLFAAKGPFESFKNLRLQVKKPAYNHVVLPFIKD
jgi:START domain